LPAAGAAAIVGQVLTNDPQPRPIRRAIVTVTGDIPGGPSVVTNDDGRFEIAGLPAGRYTVSAAKAAFLASTYGAIRPGRTGTAVVLEAGQRFNAILRMMRGGVIAGTVRDEHGQPAPGVQVAAVNARDGVPGTPGEPRPATTDDRGTFRLFGLMPGDYYLSATPRLSSSGEIQQRSTADVDGALARLRQRSPGGATPAARGTPSAPTPQPTPVAYAPTYFPGTSELRHAVRVTVGIEEERSGLDFVLAPVRVAAIEGTISGAVPNLAAVQLSLIFLNDRGDPSGMVSTSGSPILSMPPDASGRFRYINARPGNYRIVARASRSQPEPSSEPEGRDPMVIVGGGGGGGRGGAGSGQPPAPAGEYQYAVADVRVDGQDVGGVALALQPGGTFSGRIQFDASTLPLPKDQTTWLVRLSSPSGNYMASSGNTLLGMSLNSVPPAAIGADGQFELTNIAPGRYLLDVSGPERKDGWWVRSAMFGGRDLMDLTPDFTPGLDLSGVVVTLTDRRTEPRGTLQTPAGSPAPDYFVLAFPSDPTLWRAGSRRVQTARPATDGAFVIRDLPPGSYLLAALTDVTPSDWNDPNFLRQAAPSGVPVTLGEGERKVQDLRLAGPR
jgi:hypothetical protein